MFPRHFICRVSKDPQFAVFPPIFGLNLASDMSAHDALLCAWRGCGTLNSAMTSSSIEVRFSLKALACCC